MRLPAKLHYAWVVAAVTFIVLLLTAGGRAAPGILIVPLENEFHWARSTISFAIGVNLLLYGLIGPFAGALIDRFGVRRTMAAALAVTAAGVALTPAMRQSWQLILLWGVVVGTSCGVIGSFLAAFIAARWFRVRQGLVVGVLTAANAAGQLIFLPTMAGLATTAVWRVMSLLLAASVAAFVPLMALLMRDRPEDLGLAPYGADRGFRPAPAVDRNPLTLAFRALGDSARSRDFWLIAGSYFVCGASTNGLIGTQLIRPASTMVWPRSPGRVFSRRPASSAFSAERFPAGLATAWTTGCCSPGTTDCAASPYSICRSPSTCPFTVCRCFQYSTGSTGSPGSRRPFGC